MNTTIKKILIADDEAFVRLLIEQTLEDLEDNDVKILTASDGEEALSLAKSEKPQIVFLDVMMPKMNGFDVCKALKQEQDLKNSYVVILTAKGQEFDRRLSEEVGADLYMTKPFDPDEILNLTNRVLETS